jgi:class 3 adenylate cyclase/tetratricopeptide (TPR) repeat protein
MTCPHCSFDNPPGMKFCGQCGTKLAPVCARCGTENPAGFKFCGECGNPLGAAPTPPPPPPAPPQPLERAAVVRAATLQSYTPPHLASRILQSRAALEGERKQVTVLFCDLVGSTSLAEKLGPEPMHELLNRFFELALAEIHRYEGTINQFLGDGFMALFGAPITHEDHARRAVLAALGVHDRLAERAAELIPELVPELIPEQGLELAVRMGLNTGWVVVGGIGDHLRMDYTAVGDTTNLAARLQQMAQPGQILVSESTHRLVHGEVRMESLGPARVKGKEAPVLAFQVLGRGEATAAAVRSPFVGRQRELAALGELVDQAAAGQGQVVGVTGEAGAGKSRLLQEQRQRTATAAWLNGRCLSYGAAVPYLPFLHLLRRRWEIADDEPADQVVAKVGAGLDAAGLDRAALLPYLARLLGVEENAGLFDGLAALSPQALHARTFSALRQTLLAMGGGSLVVLEIEDLHWIDETSEEFLSYLVEAAATARVLVLLTYRAGYQARWMEKSYATQISLRRLSATESREVIDSVLRRAQLSADLAHTVLEKADGNPFFLEELARSLLESTSLDDVTVPDTVQGVLLARIDRLPEEHKRLLQTAAVLGREFPRELLEALWEEPAGLPGLLTELKRWEFLYEDLSADRSVYFFKHALTQEAVYQTLLTGRRQTLHLAAARALEALHAGRLAEAIDQLAYHYSNTGEAELAVTYLALAAGRAAAGYAHAEAAKALRQALGHAARLPAVERDRRTLALVLQLAESLLPLARFPETLDLLLEHRAAVERLADPQIVGRWEFWLAHTYSYLGRQDEAAESAGRAIAAAAACGDTATEGKTRYVLSRDAFWAGRFAPGIEEGLQALALLGKSGERWWEGQAEGVAGFHHYVLGQFESAFAAMERAHRIWEALADPRLDPSWSTGYFYASLGDAEAGIAHCKGGYERAQDPLNTAASLGFLGYAYFASGDLPRALETLEEAVQQVRRAGMPQLLGWFLAFQSEVHLALGRPAEAAELAEEARAILQEVRFHYGQGLAERALGRALLAQGAQAEAERTLEQALATFEALEVPLEAGRTHRDLVRLHQAAGRPEQAQRHLARADALFKRLGGERRSTAPDPQPAAVAPS